MGIGASSRMYLKAVGQSNLWGHRAYDEHTGSKAMLGSMRRVHGRLEASLDDEGMRGCCIFLRDTGEGSCIFLTTSGHIAMKYEI